LRGSSSIITKKAAVIHKSLAPFNQTHRNLQLFDNHSQISFTMSDLQLLSSIKVGDLELPNRLSLAPLTRARYVVTVH
jgi:hypothetical protein